MSKIQELEASLALLSGFAREVVEQQIEELKKNNPFESDPRLAYIYNLIERIADFPIQQNLTASKKICYVQKGEIFWSKKVVDYFFSNGYTEYETVVEVWFHNGYSKNIVHGTKDSPYKGYHALYMLALHELAHAQVDKRYGGIQKINNRWQIHSYRFMLELDSLIKKHPYEKVEA